MASRLLLLNHPAESPQPRARHHKNVLQDMKTLVTILFSILGLATFAFAHPQVEHLKESYKAQGDDFFVPLYWLPETRQIVLKHIPDHENWVGFETGYWKKIKEEDKLLLLTELGAEFDRLDGDKLEQSWRRIRDWGRISSQLSLLEIFLDQSEGFLDLAFSDPTLRPAFKWIIDRRKPDFDTKDIGATFASGELATFYPHLIQHLLNTPEKERLECFSRLLARIAATKTTKAEQAVPSDGHKPSSHSSSTDPTAPADAH